MHSMRMTVCFVTHVPDHVVSGFVTSAAWLLIGWLVVRSRELIGRRSCARLGLERPAVKEWRGESPHSTPTLLPVVPTLGHTGD